MKKARTSPAGSMREFERRAQEILGELQKTLLLDHAAAVIGINVGTGEFVLAPTREGAWQEFRRRWPGALAYVTRVDGGPVVKFHGK